MALSNSQRAKIIEKLKQGPFHTPEELREWLDVEQIDLLEFYDAIDYDAASIYSMKRTTNDKTHKTLVG